MNNCFNKDSFSIFNENIKLMETNHLYETRAAKNSLLFVPNNLSQIWKKSNCPFSHSCMKLFPRKVN